MKGGRKDRIWRHGDAKIMHCGRCGGHVRGVITREGPKWVFLCAGGHHVFKTLIKEKEQCEAEGLLTKVPIDPRYVARKEVATQESSRRRAAALYGAQFRELGHHPFV